MPSEGLLEEEAVVDAVEGETCWVTATRRSACGACSARSGCGSGVLAEVLGKRTPRVRALNRAGARPGDRVVVAVTPGAFLRSSLAMYLVPLLGLLGGGMAGTLMAGNLGLAGADGLALAGGLAGASIAMLWVRAFARRVAVDPRYQPVVLRRASTGTGMPLPVAQPGALHLEFRQPQTSGETPER